MSDEADVLVERSGCVGRVVMNRPRALNSLSFEIITGLAAALDDFEHDDSVKAITIEGAGDRAFCAGGDLKSVYQVEKDDAMLFFEHEYALNRRLFHYSKPIIALMDGITMGGGFGVAGPCKYRVATDRTVFAMPEVGIGFFPDVGSVYFLNQCHKSTKGQVGAFIAVTGLPITPSDMLYAGLCSHYVKSQDIGELKQKLVADLLLDDSSAQVIKKIQACLLDFHEFPTEKGIVEQNQSLINKCFLHSSIEEVVVSLERESSDWAQDILQVLVTRSPLSLKIALAYLRKAAGEDFDTVSRRDYKMVSHFLDGHDFREGIRAQVIDKDKKPRWMPQTLADVDEELLTHYFS